MTFPLDYALGHTDTQSTAGTCSPVWHVGELHGGDDGDNVEEWYLDGDQPEWNFNVFLRLSII